MARIHLIRHGQTAWNVEQVFRGRKDLPLSDHGLAQAEAVGKRLADGPIEAIYASPMLRAVQTVEPLAKRKGLAIERVEDLIDVDFGEWQGKTLDEVKAAYPGLYATWETDPYAMTFPGGEASADVARRATAALRDLAARAGDAVIAVVAHRFVNKMVICSLLEIERTGFFQIKQDTACINTLVVEGGRTVVESLNFTAHLEPLPGGPEADF